MTHATDDTGKPVATGVPSAITPMPLMWAQTPSGMVYWNVPANKWILCAPGEPEEMYELWIGGLCDEHGFEGTFVGLADTQCEAFAWVCGLILAPMMH